MPSAAWYTTAALPQTPAARRSWWTRLPTPGKVALIVGAVAVLCCGGFATVGAIAGSPDPTPSKAVVAAATSPLASDVPSVSDAEVTGEPSATFGAPSATAAVSPTVVKRTVIEKQSIPYSTSRVNDSSLAKGTTRVRTKGVAGVKTLTYEVTFTNGVQTSKTLIRTETTRQPVTQVIAVGTKQTSKCDPNYSGCVPIASDVDCAGGSGNGPAYVQGPVRVIGSDIYDLDSDGDGIACE